MKFYGGLRQLVIGVWLNKDKKGGRQIIIQSLKNFNYWDYCYFTPKQMKLYQTIISIWITKFYHLMNHEEGSPTPVSYTHLDVYKRQVSL